MKQLIMIMLFLPALALADNFETSVSAYIAVESDQDNINGAAVMGSVFYTKYRIDVGAELLAGRNESGIFLSGRHPINNKWNVGAGIGKVGYDVKTDNGDYYTKPTALMLFSDYKTEYGTLISRIIMSESSKNYYYQTCIHTSSPPDYHLDSCNGTTNGTNNARRVIMFGYKYEF